MTKRPIDMPERPDHADDALTELFRAVRFTRCIYYTMAGVPPPSPIHVPEGVAIAGALGARTRTVLSYHVLVEGTLFTGLETGEVVKLEPGDVIVYPRGDTYFLAHANVAFPPADDPAKLRGLLAGVASGALPPAFVFGDGENRMRVVCGFLGCDPRPFDPLLDALPRMLHVKRIDGRLKDLVDVALANTDGVGAASVRERLSESMFIETVRRHVEHLAPERAGWLGGLHDPIVGRALALMHADLAATWTLASLAKKCAASRSVLAERFTKLVGQPPMQYLARARMQTAAQLLRRRGATVAEIARDVGYESEAAFSRAFKKTHGVAPSDWILS